MVLAPPPRTRAGGGLPPCGSTPGLVLSAAMVQDGKAGRGVPRQGLPLSSHLHGGLN